MTNMNPIFMIDVDDICDGGGTFIGIFDELEKIGVICKLDAAISLFVTHGIFSKGFKELSKRFFKLYTTDSIIYSHHDSQVIENDNKLDIEVLNIIYG